MTVCITGPGPDKLGKYSKTAYENFSRKLENIIVQLIEREDTNCFITGGAKGVDQLAFKAVHTVISGKLDGKKRPEVQNIIYEPYDNYSAYWSKTGVFGSNNYNTLKSLATRVVNINPVDTYKSTKQLNLDRDRMMINNADILLAVYDRHSDWTMKSERSRTAFCMRYAKETGKKIRKIEYSAENIITGLDITAVFCL